MLNAMHNTTDDVVSVLIQGKEPYTPIPRELSHQYCGYCAKLFPKIREVKIHFRKSDDPVPEVTVPLCTAGYFLSVLTASQSAINIYPNDVHCLDKSNARRNGQVRKSSFTDPDNGAAWDRDGTNCIILS